MQNKRQSKDTNQSGSEDEGQPAASGAGTTDDHHADTLPNASVKASQPAESHVATPPIVEERRPPPRPVLQKIGTS